MVEVNPVKNFDEMLKVMVLRGVVFMGEQKHDYTTEFDNQDFQNHIHLLAMEGNEPIGTMRIYKEGDSAKFERLAILPEHRNKGIAQKLLDAGYEFCKQENVNNVYLFCKPEVEQYWINQGYSNVNEKVLSYKNMTLIPVTKKIGTTESTPEKSRAANDEIPHILRREKGKWINRNQGGGNIIDSKKVNQR